MNSMPEQGVGDGMLQTGRERGKRGRSLLLPADPISENKELFKERVTGEWSGPGYV